MRDNKKFKRELIRKAFILSRKIIRLIDKFPNKQSAKIIANQLPKAATSIGANIIESQAASSKRDFVNFLNHSLKSGNETKFWLALSKDFGKILVDEIDDLLKETDELVRILGSSIATIRGKKKL